MQLGLRLDARYRISVAAVAALGILALLQQWVVDRRPAAGQLGAAREFVVTNGADDGAGSLREAIFSAAKADGRARIVLRAEAITLRTPLPPLVNPAGVVIVAETEGATVDGRGAGDKPVLDVDAPNSAVSGVTFDNASAQAILVRVDGFHITGATIRNADEGLLAVAGINRLVVEGTRFENNRIGIKLESAAAGIVLRNNTFSGHRDAAFWAVRPDPAAEPRLGSIVLEGNHFGNDRISVVLGNMPATVERNEFNKAREVAMLLIGQGATVRNNRIRGGAGIGIFADGTHRSVIEANEIDHNAALAVLVRGSRGTLVRNNRVYENGYGIAFVLNEHGDPSVAVDNMLLTQTNDGIIVIGDSPVLRRNAARNNRAAGLRILNFQPLSGPRIPSNPFLDGNTLDGNTINDPVHGWYHVKREEVEK